jgi:4,5-dihydroxyphthalate decarboxylase
MEASQTAATPKNPLTLRMALGDYPYTLPLKQGRRASPTLAFRFSPVQPVFKDFGPMVREQPFDVSELAIFTALQAKAYGKPLVLLPLVMMARFQHNCMFYNSERNRLTPADLPGRRVGVRAYSQTTGAWLRGILANDCGVDVARIKWVTFEDAHVREFRDPPGVERAGEGKNMTKMLLNGELDAAIYGAELPSEPQLRTVFADPDRAVDEWHARHGVVPINHMVVVTQALSRENPGAVREVYRLLRQDMAATHVSAPRFDFHPFGVEACRPALQLAIDYSVQQQLIPRRFSVDELFDDTTRALN